jgi:hypothetical protein
MQRSDARAQASNMPALFGISMGRRKTAGQLKTDLSRKQRFFENWVW